MLPPRRTLTFDPAGDLYVTTGDDTNPFESTGYAPIDERDGRSPFDAQRSSAHTNDLRGKVLRITPQADGTYTISDGNLFAPGRTAPCTSSCGATASAPVGRRASTG